MLRLYKCDFNLDPIRLGFFRLKALRMEIEKRIHAYRVVAYAALAFAACGIVVVVTTLPMMYNYVHLMKNTMRTEASRCRVSVFFHFVFSFLFKLITSLFR